MYVCGVCLWCGVYVYMHEFRHLLCCSLLISHCIGSLVVIKVLSSLRCKGGLLVYIYCLSNGHSIGCLTQLSNMKQTTYLSA